MKTAAAIKLSFFCKPEEDKEALLKAFKKLIPFDLEIEKIQLKKTNAEGFNERKIEIYEVMFQKDRHINAFLDYLLAKLTKEQKQQLLDQLESRLHDNLHFYLRLDKDAMVNLGQLWLTDSGNCFHIEIVVAAFPAKREAAKKILENLLIESIK
ncbi:MAG TPA: RNA-binding domain-containing protein [Candidatus Nanoarchaeia archaeon]|nr:RNA-binding domain-containing protein [Candidatus Nanoarchaeia archaeon]